LCWSFDRCAAEISTVAPFSPERAQHAEIQPQTRRRFSARNFIWAKNPLIFNLLSKKTGKKFEHPLHSKEARSTFAASLEKGAFFQV